MSALYFLLPIALAMGAGSAAVVCPRALQPTYAALSDDVMTRGVGSGSRFTGDDVDAVILSTLCSEFDRSPPVKNTSEPISRS